MTSNSLVSRLLRFAVCIAALLVLAGCAAGPASKWAPPEAEAAGFFAGLWHGLLLILTLIVSFFTKDVRIYEIHNTGVAYDIGFVLGVLAMSSSGVKVTSCGGSKRSRVKTDKEWDEIGRRVEKNVRVQISSWVDEDDWKDVGEKIEKKVKEGLRRWLDEEEKQGS